jgi:hypothetical protein
MSERKSHYASEPRIAAPEATPEPEAPPAAPTETPAGAALLRRLYALQRLTTPPDTTCVITRLDGGPWWVELQLAGALTNAHGATLAEALAAALDRAAGAPAPSATITP